MDFLDRATSAARDRIVAAVTAGGGEFLADGTVFRGPRPTPPALREGLGSVCGRSLTAVGATGDLVVTVTSSTLSESELRTFGRVATAVAAAAATGDPALPSVPAAQATRETSSSTRTPVRETASAGTPATSAVPSDERVARIATEAVRDYLTGRSSSSTSGRVSEAAVDDAPDLDTPAGRGAWRHQLGSDAVQPLVVAAVSRSEWMASALRNAPTLPTPVPSESGPEIELPDPTTPEGRRVHAAFWAAVYRQRL